MIPTLRLYNPHLLMQESGLWKVNKWHLITVSHGVSSSEPFSLINVAGFSFM